MPIDITGPIQEMWPNCPLPLLQGIIDTSDDVFAKFGMTDNRPRIVHAMTQFSAETDGGSPNELVENLNYSSVEHIKKVFARLRGLPDTEVAKLVHNPEALGEAAYGGRMGNDQPGDGYRCRGQGLLNSTGKGLINQILQVAGINPPDPAALLAPNTAFLCAIADFVGVCCCLPYADADDLLGVSSMVNVGHVVANASMINGWDNRVVWYQRWSRAIP
jgi:putative chitinase